MLRLIFTSALSTLVLQQPLAAQAVADLSPTLDSARRQAAIPALVAVVVASDSVLARGVAGVRDVNADVPATLDDLWHIGSVTKSFTTTLAAKLEAEGAFSWDLRLGEVLPEARGTPFDTIPASALARHVSGMQPNPPIAWFDEARSSELPLTEQRRAVVARALAAGPRFPPGSDMGYSNLGYMALGLVLETVTGEPWQELVRSNVLDPLGLTSAGFGAPGSADADEVDQPRGHRRGRGGELASFPGLDNPAALGPAGTLHMSAGDLARYAREHLRGERGIDGLLSAEAFRRLHEGGLGDYAFGWVDATDELGRRLIWHNGSNTAWYAYVGLIPEADRAFVIVANDGGARPAVHELLARLIEEWAPGGVEPWER
jgi:CubicO group peptidase (beta-lactamase class C family)